MSIKLLKRSAWLIATGLGLSAQVLGQSSGCGGENVLTYHEVGYNLTEVGGVCWFVDDLKTKNLNTGERMFDSTTASFINSSNPWAMAEQTPSFIELFGTAVVYDYYALTSDQLCPKGWHVPSVDDWIAMVEIGTSGLLTSNYDYGLVFANDVNLVWQDFGWGLSTSLNQGEVRYGDYTYVQTTGTAISGASTRCVKD